MSTSPTSPMSPMSPTSPTSPVGRYRYGSSDQPRSLAEIADDEMTQGLVQLGLEGSPAAVRLRRYLSPQSLISTSSSFAARQQLGQFQSLPFKSIGAGQCGTVYEIPGSMLVLKMHNLKLPVELLWNDYIRHCAIHDAFRKLEIGSLSVPRPHQYVRLHEDETWFRLYGDRFPADAQKSDILVAERILPLPAPIRAGLIEAFCPEKMQPAVMTSEKSKSCVARILLGHRHVRTHERPRLFFSLRNFPLTMDKIETLGYDAHKYAMAMGEGLAVLNWQAGVDGADVEWVLGTTAMPALDTMLSPTKLPLSELEALPPRTSTGPMSMSQIDFSKRRTHIWLLDFNMCKKITMDEAGVRQIVSAFYGNDPYYPRPLSSHSNDQRLWRIFKNTYLSTAAKILSERSDLKLKHVQHLPQTVIDMLVSERQKEAQRRLDNEGKDYDSIPDERDMFRG